VTRAVRAIAAACLLLALGTVSVEASARSCSVCVATVAARLLCPALGRALTELGLPGQQAAPDERRATTDRVTTIRIGIAREGGYAVRTIELEEYVAGVLVGEAARNSSPSALEALAITIRTYALANRGRHKADGFDLCDQTHCQVLRKATPATERAAAATAGRVLLDRGAPASVFYTASCGGRTERPSDVWPGAQDPSFLPSRDDDACEGTPVWTAELAAPDLARALRAGGFKGGSLRNLRILARTGSGRVARLRVEGFQPEEISGQDLRVIVGRTLGWQHIKSTAFDVRRTSAGYRFSGRGSGHGVGLCVIGSARLGARGESASAILARYFPGLSIGQAPPSSAAAAPRLSAPPPGGGREPRIGVPTVERPAGAPSAAQPAAARPEGPEILVSLPAGDEGERDVIHDLAVGARDGLMRDLGVPAPARISLRFHATIESYQRATGRPWYTAAATTKDEVHLAPLTVLRDRGVLERTLRRELVHVMTEPLLASRPLWVREGVARYFSGERPPGGEPGGNDPRARISCPADDELRHPVSAGALSNAYARASACVARQMAAGKKWTEVK
jgi:SpoIID/LytB domain protein